MLEQDSSLDEIIVEVYRAIYAALESRLHLIDSVIDADSRKEILAKQIYDKGDFYGNTGYLLQTTDTAMVLRVGSNVKHEPFVLGGKATFLDSDRSTNLLDRTQAPVLERYN